MSKEKVDAYREQKKHRKENIAKDRARKARNKLIAYVAAAVIVVGIAGALVLTGYNQWKAYEAAKPSYDVTSQIVNDYSGVTSMDEEAETVAAEAETEAE